MNHTKEEISRIYENGGEIRLLEGEEMPRIFVRGKYFPGLVNSRSLGDQVGSYIGVTSEPYVRQVKLSEGKNYFLLLLTDGVTNYLTNEKIKTIIENNDICKGVNRSNRLGQHDNNECKGIM